MVWRCSPDTLHLSRHVTDGWRREGRRHSRWLGCNLEDPAGGWAQNVTDGGFIVLSAGLEDFSTLENGQEWHHALGSLTMRV